MSQYNRQQSGSGRHYDQHTGHQQYYTEQASQSDYAPQDYQQHHGYSQQPSYPAYDAPQPEYQSAPIKPQR